MRTILQHRPTKPPPKPSVRFQAVCQQIVLHPWFDKVATAILVFGMLIVASDYADATEGHQMFLRVMEGLFTAWFCIESGLLIFGLGIRVVLDNNWHVLTVCSTALALLAYIINIDVSSIEFCVIRLLRVVRLFRFFPGLTALLESMVVSAPALLNVAMFTFLFCICFALYGMYYFGQINVEKTQFLTHYINFSDFPKSLLLVYVMSTGENWPGIMNDIAIQPPLCDDTKDECGVIWSPLFALLIQFVIAMTLMNSFFAIVLDSFNDNLQKQKEETEYVAALGEFGRLWTNFDRSCSLWIDFPNLMVLSVKTKSLLNPVLRSQKEQQQNQQRRNSVLQRTISLSDAEFLLRDVFHDLRVHDNQVYYSDVLYALLYQWLGERMPPKLIDLFQKKYLKKSHSEPFKRDLEGMPFATLLAVLRIQRTFRAFCARKRCEELRKTKQRLAMEKLMENEERKTRPEGGEISGQGFDS